MAGLLQMPMCALAGACILVSCSNAPRAGRDVSSGDVGVPNPDVRVVEESPSDVFVNDDTAPVDLGTRCERGTYWDGEKCSVLVGCSGIALVRDEHGCVFFPGTMGRLTTAECEADEDCVNSPYGPNCILRVCHETPPCQTNEDCDDGNECVQQATCMPPPGACEDHDDCPDPAFCHHIEGMCI